MSKKSTAGRRSRDTRQNAGIAPAELYYNYNTISRAICQELLNTDRHRDGIRTESVWVETGTDTNGTGRSDRIEVYVVRPEPPTESLPAVVRADPYDIASQPVDAQDLDGVALPEASNDAFGSREVELYVPESGTTSGENAGVAPSDRRFGVHATLPCYMVGTTTSRIMEPIRVLRVAADPGDLDSLDGVPNPDRFAVDAVPTGADALDALEDGGVDCVVSDYDLPGRTGLDLLVAVRESHPDLPFILFADEGSEAVASEAISAGVTEYLPRWDRQGEPELLATRIETAVGQYHAERALARQNDLFEKAQAIADVGAWEYDVTTETLYVTAQTLRIHGLPTDADLSPEESIDQYHADDRDEIRTAFRRAVRDGESYDLELRFRSVDGDLGWVRTQGEPQTEDGEVVRVRGTIQDVTERKRREDELRRKNERLEEFARIVSHDIRNPLQVASGHLERAEATGDSEAFEHVRDSHDRIAAIIEDLLTLARQGDSIGETQAVDLDRIAREAWATVDTSSHTLRTVSGYHVVADRDRLRQLFENLFGNAARHAGADVTVSVGPIEPMPTSTRDPSARRGFYVADDGEGIPPDERSKVFETGYSTAEQGTGFGLSIVEQIADAHGWELELTDSAGGGTRFEITGVAFADR